MTTQACPNCSEAHDVGVYVTGQKILCGCGLRFEVKRTDVPAPNRSSASEVNDRNGSDGSDLSSQSADLDHTFVGAAAGVEIPGYEMREILGKGGMGEVWRAVQRSLGREVAIKILPPKLARDPEFVARFDKEATALASLSHPNIIQIIDRGIAQDHYYFVMEYVPGRSLREVMNAEKVSPQQALQIVIQVCQAIDCAHEKQIIHRDLKPENILVDERGHVKVADFGLAGIQHTDAQLHLTATSVAMGTVNYMAPEQRRDAKNVDGRADLYSLGVVLYELLTGELPIGRFKLPSQRVEGLDPRVDPIVARALEPEPKARYARASAIGADLEKLIESGGSAQLAVPRSGVGEALEPSKVSTKRSGQPSSAGRMVIQTSWRGIRIALMVVGALAVLAFLIKHWVGPVSIHLAKNDGDTVVFNGTDVDVVHLKKHDHAGPGRYPANTEGELFASGTWKESPEGRGELMVDFEEGSEEINAHAGTWKLEDGKLKATQAGSETGGQKLVPRAYIAHRYFSSDDFAAQVDVKLHALEEDFPIEENAQHFGELAFRIKDLQVAAFALDRVGMRLSWRYLTPAGVEITGNSARDLENLVEDEMPAPPDGTTFRVKLSLKKRGAGTEVEAFVNGQRFAKKMLPHLQGRVGKIALGCRNLHCEFDNLTASGKLESRPMSKKIAEVE
jgi:serine/threonine protein kinase